MDNAFIQEMKAALEEELQTINKDLDSVSVPDVGDHVPGDRVPQFPNYGDDAMGENTNSPAEAADYAANANVTATLQARKKEVEDALQRIVDGTYGKDEDGNPIREERLRANPAARGEV